MRSLIYGTARRTYQIPRLVLHRLSVYRRQRRDLARAAAILPHIPPQAGMPPPTGWRIQQAEWTSTGIAVIAVGPAGQRPSVMLKLSHTGEGSASLQRQRDIQAALQADPRLGDWRALVPQPLAEGENAGQFYVVEQALSGRVPLPLPADPTACMQLQHSAAATIGQLHQRTASSIVVNAEILKRWIDEPLLRIRQVNALLPAASRNDTAIERLRTEVYGVLLGRTLQAGWIHGDFWPGNILVGPDGVTVVGIVDWERAGPAESPLHDLLQLLLYTRTLLQGCEPGDVVRAILNGAAWTHHERALLDAAGVTLLDDAAVKRAMVLMYWLRFRAATLALLPHLVHDEAWMAKNIVGVLQCL